MPKLSIIVASHYDWFLQETVTSILKNCGDIELIVVLDGYRLDKELVGDSRMTVLQRDHWDGLRPCLNAAVDYAHGEYICKLDAHCAVGENFDEIMLKNVQDNWIIHPRRYELEPIKYVPHKEAIDYEYLADPHNNQYCRIGIYSLPWIARANERKDILFDEDMMMGGSCYMMAKEHYVKRIGYLSSVGWGTFMGENVEPLFKTWLGPWDGRLMRNKKTWYAHLRKQGKYHDNYYVSTGERALGNSYQYKYWWNNSWDGAVHKLDWLIERFSPLPGWSKDYKFG